MRSLAAFAADVEVSERADDPFLEIVDVGAHVGLAALQVDHHVGDPLAGAVIGELAAAAGLEHRKARVVQVLRFRAGAAGVERRMLEQPHQFRRAAGGDRGGALLHRGNGLEIGTGASEIRHSTASGAGMR